MFKRKATSDITLCKVPITPINQIDFSSKSEQLSYFSSKAQHTHSCNYQPRSGQVKIKGYVDNMNDCNYGYYTNEYQGTEKTFFFWIVQKDLLASETTILTIQIDVFQTWIFDFNFTPCMVEREHVDNDWFGLHTIPEDFELGDYVTIKRKAVECLTKKPCFIMARTGDGDGGIFGSTYSGCSMTYYSFGDTDALSTDIKKICDMGKADSIAYIYQFPEGLFSGVSSGSTIGSAIGALQEKETFNADEQSGKFLFNGAEYKPLNNKLYCYPYMFITVKNASGGNVILKLENFKDQADIQFKIEGVLTQHPTISCTPQNYNGIENDIDDSITLDDYGLCSWNNDNYGNWFAQHQNSINAQSANATASYKASGQVIGNNYNNALENRDTATAKGIINTGISSANSLGSGNFFGATTTAIGGASNTYLDYNQASRNANNDLSNSNLMNDTNYQNAIRSIVASVQDAKVQPNTCKGSTSSNSLDVARNTATFFIEQTGIKPEYARIIDMYFQMFGYQVNSVKKPNVDTRERWNYLKTVNCSVFGDIPQEDTNAINAMFNNGLTIWHDESYLYNYEIENTIR